MKSISLPLSIENVSIDNEHSHAEISVLNQKYLALNNDKNALKDTKGRLSRQIGEAKKSGTSADSLIEEMKEISVKLKNIDKQMLELQSQANTLSNSSESDNVVTEGGKTDSPPHTFRTPEFTICEDKEFTIQEVSNTFRQHWDAYVEKTPRCSAYHAFAFKEIIEQTFGHRTFYLMALDADKRIVGILPSIELSSKLFGHFAVSIPFFNYGGAIGNTAEIEQAMIQSLIEKSKVCKLSHIEFRDTILRKDMPSKHEKVAMILKLESSEEAQWSAIGAKVRAQVNKAKPHAPIFKTGRHELIDDFYKVFARNMRDLGTPVYHKKFFKNILDKTTQSHIAVIYVGKRAASAAFLIGKHSTLEIPWASTIRDFNTMNINMFLYWNVLSFAIKHDYRYFDFGRSSKQAGTYKFKKQWGAKPYQLYWHYWLADGGDLPEINPNNPKYKLVIRAWQSLPVWVSTLIGPLIVKNLP